MSKARWNKKIDPSTFFAIITVALLVVVATVVFVSLPFFGMQGLYELLGKFGLVHIEFADGLFSNLVYFGFLFLLMYLVTLVLDIASKLIFHIVLRKKLTRRTMILNYMVQVIVSAYIFELLVRLNFTRIDLSFFGAFLLFSVIYLLYYALLDDDEME